MLWHLFISINSMSMDKGNDKIRVASSHFMFELTAHNDISWYKLFASTNFF